MQSMISFKGMEGSVGLLAAQELRAAMGICCGLGNKEIARELSCSPSTVKKSIERIFYKLGVASRSAVPTELLSRGIARKVTVWICAAFLGHAAMTDDQILRIRRPGERSFAASRIYRRAECASAVA